jgi:dTDP-4-dehydrorhamnose reductase
MKILVIGSNGMAGSVVTKYLKSKKYNVITVARDNADYSLNIENINSIESFFKENSEQFDFIVNCIGLLVNDSNNNFNRAILINSWFPHYLENVFKNTKTKIIHLSTDCVFDGVKGNYIETDSHTETNHYGRSKSLGELNNDKDITFRMSIIGPELKASGTGLMNWILTNSNKELQGWENALWNGITTLQLAKCIEKYIQNPTFTGVYHLVNNNVSINKYELLYKINQIYQLDKHIIKTTGPKNVNKILIDTRQLIDFEIPDYDRQLHELKDFK